MNKQLFYFSILVLISTAIAQPAFADAVQRIYNSATPRDEYKVLQPQEIWRCGGDNDDLLFGFIITAEIDPEDRVYLLDRWLGTVHVLSSDGQLLHQLSRQGEGPGETNQPTALTWLPGGELGITQPLPGRLVRIDRDGTPMGDIVPAGVSAQAAQFGVVTEMTWRGGTLAYCGSQTNFREGQLEMSNFLAICDLNTGEDIAKVLGKQSSDDGRTTRHETDWYWIAEGRWCLGPDGKIYTAPQRDSYAVHVYGQDGNLERIIERDYESRQRISDEIEALRKRFTQPKNEWGGGREVHISANDPCISELRVSENGELWVRHSHSSHDQAAGVFATWDVFATDGTYSRAVSIKIPGDPANDHLLFLGDNRLLLVGGFSEASDAMWGDGENGDQETAGEIVFYDLAQ